MKDSIRQAAGILQAGGLVAFPTETVYGLGAHALDPVAVARVFEAKRRPSFDPLIVHLASWDQRSLVCGTWSTTARRLAQVFSPGPLTLVLPRAPGVPSIVTSGLDTVAVRVPSHPIAHRLLVEADIPVAAPSANVFGQLSPTRADHVRRGLGDVVDVVLDGGGTRWGVESTIVDTTREVPVVLRHGAITVEQLEAEIGRIDVRVEASSSPRAPGQLDSHYAPRTPLHIVSSPRELAGLDTRTVGYLAFADASEVDFAAHEVLSASRDLREAAANLFDALHRLDESTASTICAESVPDVGLGRAINDRLRRGAIR